MITPLGSLIRKVRKEQGLSYSQLEIRSGVNRVHLNGIELGRRYPSAGTLAKIAEGLGIDLDVLGELFEPRSIKEGSPEERFWLRVDRQDEDECWLWLGRKRRDGSPYGSITIKGKEIRVHRFSYEIHYGPIPVGLEIDHKCQNKSCVNPKHLEAVTHTENMQRHFYGRGINERP